MFRRPSTGAVWRRSPAFTRRSPARRAPSSSATTTSPPGDVRVGLLRGSRTRQLVPPGRT
eukprot:15125486-Alexandrium_andersonii.AAC.1